MTALSNHNFFSSRKKFQRGFTFIELVVVVAIMLTLTFIALTRFNLLGNQGSVDTNAQAMLSVLRLARTETLASKNATNYGVHFETGKYVLFSGDTYNSTATSNKNYTLSGVEISQISLTGGVSDVVFDRIRGTTGQTGTVTLRLTSDTSKTKTIKINSSGQVSLNDTLTPSGTRLVDSRHLHFNLGWSIQNATTLTFSFPGSPTVTQNIAMAGFFDASKTEFDWSGTITVNGSDQVIRVHTHSLDSTSTNLSIHRDRRYNDKALTVSIDSKAVVSYTAAGVATIGAYGGSMTVQ